MVHPTGRLFASASKDESIVIWNCDLVKKQATVLSSAAARGGQSSADVLKDDPIVQVLNEHEHVIDCIAWANSEAAKTIDMSEYCMVALGITSESTGGLNGMLRD